jgi:hypothetical protein
MATPPSELHVITAAKNLVTYLFQVLERAPKKYRYSLIGRLENKGVDVIESLYSANAYKLGEEKRKEKQKNAQLSLFIIDYEVNLAIECGCLTLHQGEVAAKGIRICSKLLKNWTTSDEQRLLAK